MVETQTQTLIAEAKSMGLFHPQGAYDVHCANCAGRLNNMGDCSTCGQIARSVAELERRAQTDPDGVTKVLRAAIAKRKQYSPAGREKSQER